MRLPEEAGAQAVHAADLSGLAILNLSPDGAKGPLAGQGAAMPEFDVLSLDDYTYKKGAYASLSGVRSAALANGKPCWRYLDSFRYTTETDATTESDFRWDAYVGAVYGFTGHSWFIYQIDTNPDLMPLLFTTTGLYGSARTAMFQWAASLNQQFASLGRSLSLLESTDVRYVASLLQPASTTGFAKGAGGDPYLFKVSPPPATFADVALGFFKDDCGERYVLIQSQRHKGADFPNSSESSTVFKVELDFTGATDPTLDRTAIWVLDPVTDQLTARALTTTGPNSATIDLTLPAGGGLLLKYKNARAFARSLDRRRQPGTVAADEAHPLDPAADRALRVRLRNQGTAAAAAAREGAGSRARSRGGGRRLLPTRGGMTPPVGWRDLFAAHLYGAPPSHRSHPMTKISSSSPATGRFTQAGAKANEVKLKKLDGQIKTAKAEVSKFVKQMMVSRYTADGYKKALAHLHTLQKNEKTLEHTRAKLIDLMTRA